MSSLLVIALWYTSTFKLSSGNLNCITRESGRSGQNDDNFVDITCYNTAYPIMVSCGCHTHYSSEDEIDGCFQITDGSGHHACRAQNAAGGAGIYAVARCCYFPSNDVDCKYYDTSYAQNDDGVISTTCGGSSHKYLTGCSAFSAWDSLDGMYPNPDIAGYTGKLDPLALYGSHIQPNTNYPMTGYCSANNGNSGDGARANLVCCNSPTYDIDCHIRYGLIKSSTHASSAVSCDSGYTATGCSGYGTHRNINAWYLVGSECRARTGDDRDIIAVVICCRMETNAPTPDPTPSPTNQPTDDPTKDPSPAPTHYPTTDPTIDPTTDPSKDPTTDPTVYPTFDPTINPTKYPTLEPTIDPTMDPTSDPSHVPTLEPTINPSDAPSISPTLAPSISPTQPPTRAPTPQCPNLDVTVTDAVGFDKTLFEGHYVFIHNVELNDRPVFEVPQYHNDRNIQYVGLEPNGHWVIEAGPNSKETLSFGPTDRQYPPYGATSTIYNWTHNIVAGKYHLLIECVESFAPISAPTTSPTLPPTNAPTYSPSLSPSESPIANPSNAPSIAPTLTPSAPPTNAPSISPSNNPTNIPSLTPSNDPSHSPSNAPSTSPTTAPTSFCRTLTVSVDQLNGNIITGGSSQWDGIYSLDVPQSFDLDDWIGIGAANGAWIKYIGSHWVLSGINREILTYSIPNNKPDNYPPIGTSLWNMGSFGDAANVTIKCSNTYSPSSDPTHSPFTSPTPAPTNNLLGIFIKDRPDINDLFDDWYYIKTPHFVNNRAHFVYNKSPYFSELQFDINYGWIISMRIGINPSNIYSSGYYGFNPPLNEWIYFNKTDDTKIEVILNGLFTLWPTTSPTSSPISSPTEIATNNPTTSIPSKVPSVAPIINPSKSPTSYPMIAICDEINVNVPNGFPDAIATEIFNSPFIYQGMMHSIYPYWMIDCDNKIDQYTAGCNDGFSGIIYFNGIHEWVISINSKNNDYYKVYIISSSHHFVPLNGIWKDINTVSGVSESTYRFEMECNAEITSSPTSSYLTQSGERIISTDYIYNTTWFWVTCILIILFILILCILIWLFMKKRNDIKNNVVEMPKMHEIGNQNENENENSIDFVSEILPNINVPKHEAIPTVSGIYTPASITKSASPGSDHEGNKKTTQNDVQFDDDYVFQT